MAKKAAPAAKAAKPKAASAATEKKAKSRTKAEIYGALAESTGLSKKQVASVFEQLAELIKADLGKKGPQQFTVPGLLKLYVRVKPATPAVRKPDPFTKQMRDYPAKPATRKVRARPLKALNDLI
jgi:nucleoid DNA-binding protein